MIATIETFFGRDALGTPAAFLAALLIGLAFGFALESAGFGSSRRLAGIFYFRDMTVLKVMFTAMIVAMLGLSYLGSLGLIDASQLYVIPTVYGAQVIGGLLFGIGFALGGWCPGTAAVGAASGKTDAMLFLGGSVAGTVLYNELHGLVGGLASFGDRGVQLVWENLGVSLPAFALAFTAIAVGAFWGSEWIERRSGHGGEYLGSRFLQTFGMLLVVLAAGLFVIGGPRPAPTVAEGSGVAAREAALLGEVEAAADHVEPEDLADRLMAGEPGLLVVDVRSQEEYDAFHLPGALRASLPDLPALLAERGGRGPAVLYSNGMVHPAQARDSLVRLGFRDISILTDGLTGFIDRVLKPASLRSEPLTAEGAARIAAWRAYFLGGSESGGSGPPAAAPAAAGDPPGSLPGLIETGWLAENFRRDDVKVIDCRAQPAWNGGHIPGSACMSPEHFRGTVGGIPASLLPADVIARHASLLGIRPGDLVVIAGEDKLQDATLIGLALERIGHRRHGILHGGFPRWADEKRPIDTVLPRPGGTPYPAPAGSDGFTVDAATVLAAIGKPGTVILDTRPADYFQGKKSDEARAGHIPGALNRPFSEDSMKMGTAIVFKPVPELEKAYGTILPSKDVRVIVHCRTGHQASQTFFVLKNLLGYRNVLYYGAGWTEWAARPELPVEASPPADR